MELIVGKIYKEVKKEGSKQRQKKKTTEKQNQSKDLYLEFFGTETMVKIRDDQTKSKKDRRGEYVNELKKRKAIDRYQDQDFNRESMNQTVDGNMYRRKSSEVSDENENKSEVSQNPLLMSIPEHEMKGQLEESKNEQNQKAKKKKKVNKKRHKSQIKRRSLEGQNEMTFLSKLRQKQIFSSHFASLDPYTSRGVSYSLRATQNLEFPKIRVEGERSGLLKSKEKRGFLPEISINRGLKSPRRSATNLQFKTKKKVKSGKRSVDIGREESQKKIEEALIRAAGLMKKQEEDGEDMQ